MATIAITAASAATAPSAARLLAIVARVITGIRPFLIRDSHTTAPSREKSSLAPERGAATVKGIGHDRTGHPDGGGPRSAGGVKPGSVRVLRCDAKSHELLTAHLYDWLMNIRVDEAALRRLGVRLAVLFGSRARGTERPESDVDVGVLLDDAVPGFMDPRRGAIAAALSGNGETDLVFLDEADPLLLYEAAVEGRPIYEREVGAFEEYRIRAIKRYYDTAWIRRIEADALRRRYG